MRRILLNGFMFFLIAMVSPNLNGQTIQTPFGKNRVQYHDDFDNWWMYETENFVTFWYGKGRNIAKSSMQLAELDHEEIEKLLAHSMNDKIRIIIYLDHSDYTQTNISYFDTREAGGAGKARFYDNKVIVYFNGNHQYLRKQIRAGIVQAYLKSMFNGISMQEIYQNLVSSELPNWFVSGLIDYLTEKWPPQKQKELSWFFDEKPRKVKRFKSFAKENPELAGHSMWHYLSEKYGDQSISDFLYLVRIHHDIDKAFKYVYNKNDDEIYGEWYKYFRKFFNLEISSEMHLETEENILLKSKNPVIRLLIGPDDQMFYVTNNAGRIELFQKDLKDGSEKRLLKYGYRNKHQIADNQYPVLRFNNVTNKLGVIYESRDLLFFREMDLFTKEITEVLFPEQVQRIYDFEYEDEGYLIFTGSLDGFTDLFLFNIEKRQTEQLSESYFDEVEIRSFHDLNGDYLVVSNHESGLLNSARYDSFPPTNDFDVFRLNKELKSAQNLIDTDLFNEKEPFLSENGHLLLVLSDASGLYRPQVFEKSGDKYFSKGIIETKAEVITHHYSEGKYIYAFLAEPGEWVVASYNNIGTVSKHPKDLDPNLIGIREIPDFLGTGNLKENDESVDQYIEIDESLMFQTEFEDPDNGLDDWMFEEINGLGNELESGAANSYTLPVFNRSNAVASRLRFNFTELTTRIDNQALFEGLETFDQYNTSYEPPPTGFLVKSSVRDLFEDHVLEGGFRFSTDFRGMEYFLSYDDLKRKWDWKYALYRKTNFRFENIIETTPDADKIKNQVNLGLVKAKYPFDIYRSVHFSAMLRFDKTLVTASEPESFSAANVGFQRVIFGVEYIFDNTSEKAPNLFSGTRYKVFGRFSNRFNIRLSEPMVFDVSEGIMFVSGFDARHYIDVLKHSTFALRLAGQNSFGTERNIYFLGGVENWFFSQTDDTYPIPQDESFAFKVQAGNMRGFPYNIRNGSTFLVANAEIRIPVFSYLVNGHIKSAVIRDFQITGFFDAGMAWYGLTPFSAKNSANVYYLEAPPAVTLRIKQIQDPLVAGMGLGVRTTVFGYFLKLDYAWGIQSMRIQDPILYLSLGYDF